MMEQRLTLVKDRAGKDNDGHILALYVCECGTTALVQRSRVKRGLTRSCGCLAREISSKQATTHGMRNTREYSSWQAMKARCMDPNNRDYPRWGGVGIGVCDAWATSFEAFYAYLGPRPTGTSLDRIDGNGDYQPGNVRWATALEQARNRRDLVVVNTEHGSMPLVDYAKILGISKGAAHLRMKRGTLKGVSHV